MQNISRRSFLRTAAAAAATTAAPAAIAAKHGRRNVLFIGVDDLNHSLGCYGEPVQTPHLDALAARGKRFDAAYCQYPLCGPSRVSLLTGLAPDQTHVVENRVPFREALPHVVTLPQLFRQNGYYTARVGKIYHAGNPMDEGRDGDDDPLSWDYKYDNAGVDRTEQQPMLEEFSKTKTGLGDGCAAYPSPSPDRKITDSIGADEIIRLIKANAAKPFFLAFGLYRPHVPWIVPKPYFDRYPLAEIHAEPFRPAEMEQAPKPAYNSDVPNLGMSVEECQRSKQGYYASTTFIDKQIGRVLACLHEAGLDKNTLVVFWADHGFQLGQHGLWEKLTLFEWSARVPFIVAGPGISNGVVSNTTEHLDMYPTLVELCGLSGAPALTGRSLVPLLHGSADSKWVKPAVTQLHRPGKNGKASDGYSLRTERYRYTTWSGANGGEELYDHAADREELHNLASDPSMADIKAGLKQQLQSIRAART